MHSYQGCDSSICHSDMLPLIPSKVVTAEKVLHSSQSQHIETMVSGKVESMFYFSLALVRLNLILDLEFGHSITLSLSGPSFTSCARSNYLLFILQKLMIF